MDGSSNGGAPRSFTAIRVALGYVYLHFGLLKFFPDLSPAELISSQTVARLSLEWIDTRAALTWLAVLECGLGLGFLFNLRGRVLLSLFVFHMAGTFVPLFYLPELMFKVAPFAPTLDGQYILKNLILLAAGWVILRPHDRRDGDEIREEAT